MSISLLCQPGKRWGYTGRDGQEVGGVTTRADNELLTRVGKGRPMGEILRRYWVPALISDELPAPDCPPIQVRLMGEDLIAFRDSDGRVGLVEEHCAHRGASLFYGRNEGCGLRCVYHGWKYDVDGNCVDQPCEPAETSFKQKIHLTAYPCRERGGVVWAYMGPRSTMPDLPEIEWAMVPENQRQISKRYEECNWLQAVEGALDSSHISFLHMTFDTEIDDRSSTTTYSYRNDTAPRFEILDTDYGMMIAARRTVDEERYYWRYTQYLMPWYQMIPPFGDTGLRGHCWVPIDDEHVWAWSFHWHPTRTFTEEQLEAVRNWGEIHSTLVPGTYLPKAHKGNHYMIDRDMQRTKSFTGVKDVVTQDFMVQESMGPIYDRTREHLGTSDTAVIALRRRLLDVARRFKGGEEPPRISGDRYRVRAFATILPKDVPFTEGARDGTVARTGELVASV